MIADDKQKNLSWRGEVAYFRKKLPNGSEKWQSLGLLSKDDARRIVKHLVQKLTAEQLDEKLGLITRQKTLASIAEVLLAYDLYTDGIQIDAKTARDCKSALLRVIRVVKGPAYDAQNSSTSILTDELLRDYSACVISDRKRIGAAADWDEEQIDAQQKTAQRSIRSTTQQARAIFSREALQSKPYRALQLPDLTEFLAVKVGETTVVKYSPPDDSVLLKIIEDAPALRTEDPAAWVALMLMVNGALRRGSAVAAKWDWFVERGVDADKKPIVYLDVRLAKGGNSMVRFDWDLYNDLKTSRVDLGEFIIPGELAWRRDEVCERLVTWLRARGLADRRCPNHELRKWFLDLMGDKHGLTQAQFAAGHSSPALTAAVYSSRRTSHSLRVI